MDREQLSEIITQVIKKMNIEKKVLLISEYVVNGLSNHDDYRQLTEGCNISLLTSTNSKGLAATGRFERIYLPEELPVNSSEWIGQFERVIIPNPSLKTVSKIAHIILDDKFTEIVFTALQEKKPVFMGQALSCEKDSNLSAALRREIERLAGKLRDYGIQKCHPVSEKGIYRARGVISLQDAISMTKNSNELNISSGTIITPLAMDYLREKKISINRT